MKKICVIPLIFFVSFGCAFAENQNLSSQMKLSYKSGFYPGVVRFAEEILRTEKDTLASFRAAVYEGESLFRMGRVEDAISILQKYQMNGETQNPESILLNAARFYWLARGYFAQKEIAAAQSSFFASAAIYKELSDANPKATEDSLDYYALSMLYGGKCFFFAEDYKNAVPLFEYVVSNGSKFSRFDYEDSARQLAQSYNAVGDVKSAQKCELVVSQLENASFNAETTYSLLILKGEAQETQKKYKAAYDTYCTVIEKAPSALAAQAMQKAYAVSSAHKSEVGSEPGSVIASAEARLSEYPDLLSEFWTRLAVDAFNAKDYEKSRAYFGEAEPNANDAQKEIAAVYRAEIAYISATNTSEGSKNALSILLEAAKSKTLAKSETIKLSLARFSGYLKNWNDCEKYASDCMKSELPDVKETAVYWTALAKYESGDVQQAATTIENYNRELNGLSLSSYKTKTANAPIKITDKSILNLYAKALAKQGKYHDADVIFYSLGEKNQLDNDGRLDYSRTLLIAGHYVSTKEQAAKATGDEALYLSALASFNQRKWQEAESGFSKVSSSKTLAADYVAYAQFYLGYAQYQLGAYASAVTSLTRFIEENPLHDFVWSAYMTIARAAAFAKNESAAISASQNAVKTARNETDKNEAIILSAGIYSDSGRYDDALNVLAPYLTRRTPFGYECKYRSAEISVQKGNLAEADRAFAELASLQDKNAALIAEESSYRRAEIAYSSQSYKKAAELFEEYNRKFPAGRFRFAAIYFSADSLAKSGNETRAILRYLQIVDSKSETSYRYGSEKNLVDLYQKTGEYASALSMANKMIDEYGSQALNDGMSQKVKELQKSAGATETSLALQISDAEKTLAKQKNDPAQSEDALKNALFLAGAYRTKGENKKSAELYLEALKYARQAGNDELAARSFYGAVESFDAAGLYADAKATFTEMKKLYPESTFTKDAEKIAQQL
ncbi:MAG: outer membrane protein assembly factor BamD [Treponema sp.]|nr:outer membrane protein assembly factor BamD [Treponema sp.]